MKNENSLFAIIGFSLLLVATLWGSIGMPSVLKLYYLNKLEKQSLRALTMEASILTGVPMAGNGK